MNINPVLVAIIVELLLASFLIGMTIYIRKHS